MYLYKNKMYYYIYYLTSAYVLVIPLKHTYNQATLTNSRKTIFIKTVVSPLFLEQVHKRNDPTPIADKYQYQQRQVSDDSTAPNRTTPTHIA